jgi:ubiquitin carboxyl-terminal hydrolase 8
VDKSFIRETFYGQRKSFLRCLTCGFESPKYEAFFELSVPLPQGSGRVSLQQCIANLLKPEKVSWKCDRCKVERDSVKQLSIVKFPLILAIHLTRFYEDGGMWRKKQNMVDFELRDFDLEQFATVCNGKKNRYKRYNLYGVCNHFGTMEGGHYTAYCYSQVYQKWHKYDDHEVHSMNERDVKTSAAYILFYSAKN